MSRINTNLGSLQAMHTLSRNQADLSTHLQRLSTGLQINSGKDAPAGLIASENLRSEITGINQALVNSQRADNVINTAEGALSEVSGLLLEVQSLTNEAANSGALSTEEVQANQLQVDAILNSINRIANTTQFNGVKLLNGSLDYTTSSVATSAVSVVSINSANLPDNGSVSVVVSVAASAQLGDLRFNGTTVGANPLTIEVAGNDGSEQLSFAAGTTTSAVAAAINQIRTATGVSAIVSATALRLVSVNYGSDQFVSVKTITGSFINNKDYGRDADVRINGAVADVHGLQASVRNSSLDLTLDLSAAYANTPGVDKTFQITGGGAKFQIGSQVTRQGQVNIGIASTATTNLGDSITGFLSSLGSGGPNSLVSGNTVQAQKVLTSAIQKVAQIRGRLGAFQKDILASNQNSLSVALENVTASESAIRDADFASETASMTRAQILVQANTSVLAQANSTPQQVLSLLRGG